MLKTKAFKGANVFLSRNLVPPEIFDTLHDALKLNGAQIFLCCDPSRNGPNDYHVISSSDHEKFEDLKAKGCKLLGPQCLLSCAKENRPLPKQSYTCCLAMDGVKVLVSGFEMDEKAKIGNIVSAMGGVLHTKASFDVNFVIVKNVLAAKYKWALNILKKPIITINWLYQCWSEHRIVPQEAYKVLPFSGLEICVTGIPGDERKRIEKLILENGGKYSAELTKKCTHLICNAPEGDKYKVARKWGHIHMVTRKWFDQSIGKRACLNEESYPVQGGSMPSCKTVSFTSQCSQEKGIGKLQSVATLGSVDSTFPVVSSARIGVPESDLCMSQTTTSFSDVPVSDQEIHNAVPAMQPKDNLNLEGTVAKDSESDNDNDLYLSECRILLIGFEASEMRRLVNMVRRGGGCRYMYLNDRLTHIVIGTPSEMEKKDIRSIAALGMISVVRTMWLEDCDLQKKEMPVLSRHVASDMLLLKESMVSTRGTTTATNPGKNTMANQSFAADRLLRNVNQKNETSSCLEKKIEKQLMDENQRIFPKENERMAQQNQVPVIENKIKEQGKMQDNSTVQNLKSSTVFKGRIFCFSNSFPEERRAEIVQWIKQGGGELVDAFVRQNVHFIIECHSVRQSSADVRPATCVSSHWIRSCLEDGSLLNVDSHILYSPLPCNVPLPGFETLRFCVSQYEERERVLLRNLCFVLGAKFVEKLTKKVTHLLCKFTNGPKYEFACKWGIQCITSEWILECVKQNGVVAIDQFRPKDVTLQDRDAGHCITTQFHTQAVRMLCEDSTCQKPTQSHYPRDYRDQSGRGTIDNIRDGANLSGFSKKARVLQDHWENDLQTSTNKNGYSIDNMISSRDNGIKDTRDVSNAVPDVAAAIEDLLEETSKINEQSSPGRIICEKNLFSADCLDTHSVVGLPGHWLNRNVKKDDELPPSRDAAPGILDGFSETQTDSQVVGYEEDFSGRQMLIDRIRTQGSSMS